MSWRILPMTFLLLILWQGVIGQRKGMYFRTVSDWPNHWLEFVSQDQCRLIFPRFHMGPAVKPVLLAVHHKSDTITFSVDSPRDADTVLNMILRSKFKVESSTLLINLTESIPYIPAKTFERRWVYVIDGQVHRPGEKSRLRKIARAERTGQYSITLLKGKEAYDSYGLSAANYALIITTR